MIFAVPLYARIYLVLPSACVTSYCLVLPATVQLCCCVQRCPVVCHLTCDHAAVADLTHEGTCAELKLETLFLNVNGGTAFNASDDNRPSRAFKAVWL